MKLLSTLFLGVTVTLASCKQKNEDYSWVKNGIETASYQLHQSAVQFADSALRPRPISPDSRNSTTKNVISPKPSTTTVKEAVRRETHATINSPHTSPPG